MKKIYVIIENTTLFFGEPRTEASIIKEHRKEPGGSVCVLSFNPFCSVLLEIPTSMQKLKVWRGLLDYYKCSPYTFLILWTVELKMYRYLHLKENQIISIL
jgi:hypothetical protein